MLSKIQTIQLNEKYIKNFNETHLKEEKRFHSNKNILHIIFDQFKDNKDSSEIKAKILVLNSFYSTNLKNYEINKIVSIIQNIDFNLMFCDQNFKKVNELDNEIKANTGRSAYSFLSKFLYFSFPTHYYIFDNQVKESLWFFQKRDNFLNEKFTAYFWKETWIRNYENYVNVLKEFKKHYNLDSLTKEELDYFLWKFYKEIAPAKKVK